MGTSGVAGRHGGEAVVLLVACAGGGELGVVRDVLAGALRTPTVLVDRADLRELRMSLDPDAGLVTVGGRLVRPAVVWARHASAGAIGAQARPAGSVTALAAEAWSGFLKQISGLASYALPGAASGAASVPVGPGQLTDAARLGFRVPKTVVTTDVAEGSRLLRSERIVVKTPDFRLFEPDREMWVRHWPVVVEADDVSQLPGTQHPVVVQEHVAHARELRIYHLDGGLCAFNVSKPDASSPWTAPDRVTVTRVDCPEPAAKVVRTLSEAWGLRYGAFDLLLAPDGEPVFLEANPDGDWLWFERKAGWHGVSFMAAVMVRELFVRGTA